MKLKEGFVLRSVCGENVIVAEGLKVINFGKILSLNETAAWLWKQAADAGQFTVESLATALCGEYDVTQEQAEKDVAAIVGKWKELDIVED